MAAIRRNSFSVFVASDSELTSFDRLALTFVEALHCSRAVWDYNSSVGIDYDVTPRRKNDGSVLHSYNGWNSQRTGQDHCM